LSKGVYCDLYPKIRFSSARSKAVISKLVD